MKDSKPIYPEIYISQGPTPNGQNTVRIVSFLRKKHKGKYYLICHSLQSTGSSPTAGMLQAFHQQVYVSLILHKPQPGKLKDVNGIIMDDKDPDQTPEEERVRKRYCP